MNVIGAKTLFMNEVRRFLRVPGQTVLQPLISTSLYFVVFAYTLGGRQSEVEGVPYVHFIVPELRAQKTHTNTKESFPGTGFDVLPAVPSRRATSHY